ncbi:MAG: cytochrome C oxidase subunit II [Nitrospinae bacterium]|nr:cytochrome C oxidase subunit II [Nitrospinota bacterium]
MSVMKVVYVLYFTVVVSMFGMYAWSITRQGKVQTKIKIPFYGWVGLLVFVGVGLHVFTFNALPWVKWDLARSKIRPDKEYSIVATNHTFRIPREGLVVREGQMVRFNVESRDYTYGFGLFRADGSMVFQMQVVPGASNDIVWKFDKAGAYTIRSTEYSGPQGVGMVYRDAVSVAPVAALAQAKADI